MRTEPPSGRRLQQEKPDAGHSGRDAARNRRRGAFATYARKTRICEDIPVVMATAKDSEIDKIQGLDLGADYYLTKPFGVMELVSCVKAVLRRCEPRQAEQLLQFRRAGASNLDQHKVTVDGKPAALTYKEFELLRLFLSEPRYCLYPRSAVRQGLGAGFLRRDPHHRHPHPDPATEAGSLRRHDPDRAQRGLPAGGTKV